MQLVEPVKVFELVDCFKGSIHYKLRACVDILVVNPVQIQRI